MSPTTAGDVRADLGDDVDVVLDDGPCTVGVESTIVDCTGDDLVILRPGGVTRERIEEVSGQAVGVRSDGLVRAPGTLKSHYAPEATVLVVDRQDFAERATALLAAGERVAVLAPDPIPALPGDVVALEAPANADEYARVLYARLREADRRGVDVLLAVPPPDACCVALVPLSQDDSFGVIVHTVKLYFSLTSHVSAACPGKGEKYEYRFRMSKSALPLLRTSRA